MTYTSGGDTILTVIRRMLFAFTVLWLVLLPGVARSVTFSVPPVDEVKDLHGDPSRAQLVIFLAGNQYMLMPALLAKFREVHPEVRDVYYETLPPGIVAKQMEQGALQIGNLTVRVRPDVFMAGTRRMTMLRRAGFVHAAHVYAVNELAIMVHAGNPLHIESLRDLGRPRVRVAMPNPAWEGVGEQIDLAYRKAGGEPLEHAIMVTKVRAGSTILTRIHHRQTPLFILDRRADAGPVWISEALYQQRIGAPLQTVRIPASENVTARYEAAQVREAPHPALAKAFVEFLTTPAARAVYRAYGFGEPK